MDSGKMKFGRPVAARKKRINDYLRFAMFATAAAITTTFQWGCIREDYNGSPGTATGDDVEVMIMMNVPSVASSTRAMTKKQENSIDYLNVLVFLDPRDGSDETYLYTTYATDYLASDDGSTSTVKVGFRKNVSGEYHRFVFIANMKDRIAELQGSWDETMTKADVLETLTFDAYAATASTEPERVWDTGTPRYLPMWGETSDSYVVTSSLMGSTLGTIKMLRSVATVDIVLNPDVDGSPLGFGSGVFELQDIKVYNVPQKGYAAPDPDNLTVMLAEKPTYSTTFTRNAATVVAYETDQTADEHLYGISRLVYIPEAPNTDGAGTNIDDLEQTCLVISGYYDGSPDLSWYRLDFIDKLSATENVRYDILRNHRYTFYITAVEGPGYPDEPTAFKSAPLNLDTEVLVWDEENMPDIVFDGNYAFRVNPPDSVVMYKEGSKKYITVKTDHPGGWDIDLATMPDFILNHWIEPGTDRDTLYFEATPITNTVELDRKGYITFLSGKLRKKVKIIQLNEAELTLEIEPAYIYFNKTANQAKSVMVTTYPKGIPIYFSEIRGDDYPTGYISWRPSGYPNATENSGSGLYSFHPANIETDPAEQRTSSFSVMVMSGNKRVTKIIEIIQRVTDLVFSWTPRDSAFDPEAAQQTLTVTSDTDWWVESYDNTEGIFNGQPSYSRNSAGVTDYLFNLTGNNTWYPRSGTLTVKSDDDDFPGDYIGILQSAKEPAISINRSGTIDITSAANTVTVTSNAKWKYAGDANFANTATATEANSGSDTPLSNVQKGTVTFTAKSWTSANGTPLAGTPAAGYEYSSVVTFTTDAGTSTDPDYSSIEQKKASFTLKSMVPGFWTAGNWGVNSTAVSPANNAYISSAQPTTVTVYANTNAKWKLTPQASVNPQITSVEQAANTYQTNRPQTISIPIYNNGWGDRKITLTVTNDANGTSPVYTYNQIGYYVNTTNSSHTAPALTDMGGGGNVTMRISGCFPANRVRVRITSVDSATPTATQIVSNVVNVTASGSLTVSGGVATRTVNNNGAATVRLNNNTTTTSRNVYFQYQYTTNTNGNFNDAATTSAWKTFANDSQPRGHILVNNTAYVASADLSGIYNWTNANAACASYTEGGYSWRLPTNDEAVAMGLIWQTIGLDTGRSYWINYQLPATQDRHMALTWLSNSWQGNNTFSTSQINVRCVRTP